MLSLLLAALHLYSIAILVAVVFSWVGASPGNPLVRVLRDMTEPVFGGIRRRLPFVVADRIDFSPLVALLLIEGARWLIQTSVR